MIRLGNRKLLANFDRSFFLWNTLFRQIMLEMFPELPRRITVRVKLGNDTPISLDCDRYDTVFSLKEAITNFTKILPAQQRLVYAGKVLVNELSLNFYNIGDNTLIYLVPTPADKRVRRHPYEMMNRLLTLVEELPKANSRQYTDIVREMNSIMDHPTVQGLARIDSAAQQILEDAEDLLMSTDRPLSRRTQETIAQAQDAGYAQLDTCPEGWRLMTSAVNSWIDSEDDTYDYDVQITNIVQQRELSDKPLPNPWAKPRQTMIFNDIPLDLLEDCGSSRLRTQYSKQLATLRNMGFNDENIMLQALSQTGGNVQKAVKLLQNRFFM